MGAKSEIQWTDATWNPVTGCSKVSPGCSYCYAEALSLRWGWSRQPWTPEHAAENVILHPERLELPLHWRKPQRIFVNSMSDLFHELVPDSFIDQVFAIMALCPQHVFQVLTKRPARMRAYLHRMAPPDYSAARDDGVLEAMQTFEVAPWRRLRGRTLDLYLDDDGHIDEIQLLWPLPNVWLGTSVENQRWADERVPILLDTPAAVRFLSCEPLLGWVDLSAYLGLAQCEDGYCASPGPRALHWVITGGESGPHFRPFQPAWAADIRDQCQAAGVAYLHKQNGGRTPKAGGRLLDGREWNEFPATEAAHA